MNCPDPNQPPGPCAFHLLKDSAPIRTTKRIKREEAAEVENIALSIEAQMMMEIDIKDEDMKGSAFSQDIQMEIEEDSTAPELADGWTLKNKREYVAVQEEILGRMSDWKRRKLEEKKRGSKFENYKVTRLEEEDNTFVLMTEQGDLRYVFSARMEMDVEEQIFKTEQGDVKDRSSIQTKMEVDEQDIFVSTIQSLGPGRPFVGYPPEHIVDGKGYCRTCFVLGSKQGHLGGSSSAVVKMEKDDQNIFTD